MEPKDASLFIKDLEDKVGIEKAYRLVAEMFYLPPNSKIKVELNGENRISSADLDSLIILKQPFSNGYMQEIRNTLNLEKVIHAYNICKASAVLYKSNRLAPDYIAVSDRGFVPTNEPHITERDHREEASNYWRDLTTHANKTNPLILLSAVVKPTSAVESELEKILPDIALTSVYLEKGKDSKESVYNITFYQVKMPDCELKHAGKGEIFVLPPFIPHDDEAAPSIKRWAPQKDFGKHAHPDDYG